MKRKYFVVALVIMAMMLLAGCNYDMVDTTYSYDKAIIKLANDEVIEVEIDSWKDYDGEQIQIKDVNGNVYLTNSFRCDLIKYRKK